MKTVAEIRIKNMELLVAELGTLDAVASAAGSSSVYLSQLRKGAVDIKTGKAREMGSKIARRLELGCGKPNGWLDAEHPGYEAHGANLSPKGSVERGNRSESRDALHGSTGERISTGPRQLIESSVSGTLHSVTSSNATVVGIRRPAERRVVSLHAMDVEASMNGGGVVRWHEDVVTTMGVDETWLRRNADFTAIENLALVTAAGDDMEPTFSTGDPLLIDRGINQVGMTSIYMVMLGRKLYIRRMQRLKDDSLMMLADNQKYHAESFDKKEFEQLRVLGRVAMAWNSRRIG